MTHQQHGPEPMTDEELGIIHDDDMVQTRFELCRAISTARDAQWREWMGKQDCGCADQTDCTGACCVKREQAEPVAWMGYSPTKGNGYKVFLNRHLADSYSMEVTPLYATPPAALLRQALEALVGVLKAHRITKSRGLPDTYAEANRIRDQIIYAVADAEKAITAIKQHLGEV